MNNELKHYGVLGMKWGRRKSQYISVAQGSRRARAARRDAYNETTTKNGGKIYGGVIAKHPNFKAKREARKAADEAYSKSLQESRSYNKQLRDAGKSDLRKRYDAAKVARKQAQKEYSKSYDAASNYSSRHPISQWVNKKHISESDRRWKDAWEKAGVANEAHEAYSKVNKERKTAIKDAYKEINKNSSLGEKFLYNEATRKGAAKYVVDHNMSIADAKKKANEEAIRNTAIFLAALGAYSVYQNKK